MLSLNLIAAPIARLTKRVKNAFGGDAAPICISNTDAKAWEELAYHFKVFPAAHPIFGTFRSSGRR